MGIINWDVVFPYYTIAIVVVAVLYFLSGNINNKLLQTIVRSGIVANLLTPWVSVGEGVHLVPASIIAYYGLYAVGWSEFSWGFIPILVVWVATFIIVVTFNYAKHKLHKKTHDV